MEPSISQYSLRNDENPAIMIEDVGEDDIVDESRHLEEHREPLTPQYTLLNEELPIVIQQEMDQDDTVVSTSYSESNCATRCCIECCVTRCCTECCLERCCIECCVTRCCIECIFYKIIKCRIVSNSFKGRCSLCIHYDKYARVFIPYIEFPCCCDIVCCNN
jgi:hypothetical protein